MKKLISLLAILLITTACSDIYAPKEIEYLIPSGQHESRVQNGFAADKIRTLKSNDFSFTEIQLRKRQYRNLCLCLFKQCDELPLYG